MNKDDVIKFIDSSIEEAVRKVESGEAQEEEIPFARPDRVKTFLFKEGFEELGYNGYELYNGWSWDYTIFFKKGKKIYRLSGDGYYNDQCYFCYDEYMTENHTGDE